MAGRYARRAVSRSRRISHGEKSAAPDVVPPWPLSDGEIHFLYWFSQGSIMIPETRWRLRNSWGFCERHAWGHLAVEMAFRHRFLLSPTILYADLMKRCLDAFGVRGPWQARRLAHRLSLKGPCMMCEMNVYRAGRGAAPMALIAKGRQTDELRAFALETRDHWRGAVCGLCRGDASRARCRQHLLEDIADGKRIMLGRHRTRLARAYDRLLVYDRSFLWGNRDTEGPEDRAALFSTVGWLSGWRPLLILVEGTATGS